VRTEPRHLPLDGSHHRRGTGTWRVAAAVAVVALGLGACSGDGGSGANTTIASMEVLARFTASDDAATRSATAEVLTRRFALAGYPTATARVDGDEVVVEAPTSVQPFLAENLAALTRPGQVTFQPVLAVVDEPTEDGTPATGSVAEGLDGSRYELGAVALSGGVERAVASAGAAGDAPVQITFVAGADGIDAFNRAAAQCFDRSVLCPTGQLAVVVDGVVINAPEIDTPAFARDRVNLSGLGVDTARGLAVVLSSGPLPGPLVPA